ncbi:MAG TPA: hypothetical protein VG476_16615 [Acidimicrobiales bacterium]|nr:hypothetical protein [Acidimicrobiales bacterium]
MKQHQQLLESAVGAPATGSLTIVPWSDPVIDALGHDPRSPYVETYWLAVIGPSTTWLLRRLAFRLEAEPDGFFLDLPEMARCLGLGAKGGRHSPFVRTLGRCVDFGLARVDGYDSLAVRRRLPPLSRRQVLHLPESLQRGHRQWEDAQLRLADAGQRQRSRQLALSLSRLGEDHEAIERQLREWRFSPAVADEAAAWACRQRPVVSEGQAAGGVPRTATAAR